MLAKEKTALDFCLLMSFSYLPSSFWPLSLCLYSSHTGYAQHNQTFSCVCNNMLASLGAKKKGNWTKRHKTCYF